MKNSKTPKFRKDLPCGFFNSLKERVRPILLRNKEKAHRITITKLIFYPLIYLLLMAMLYSQGESLLLFYLCYISVGMMVTIIVFNLVHDAVHHSLLENAAANNKVALLLDMMGGNSFTWAKRHVIYHHSFTNVPGWDIDIKQTNIVKFDPRQTHSPHYRYQHLYMPIVYLFYSLNWIFVRDFKDYFSKNSFLKQKGKIPTREYYKLFAFKFIYLIYIIVAPAILLTHEWYHFVLAFLSMHWFSSALTLLVILPSHLDEHAQFPKPGDDSVMQDSWAVHQIKVTNDFGTHNWFLNFIMGGLNHHIAHHLFPNSNHNLVRYLTPEIKIAAEESGLPYRCYTLSEVMVSHFKLLKNNGRQIDFFEE